MKTNLYFYSQLNYLPRTAIEAEILFAVCLSKKKALTGGKFLAREDKYSKKIGVKSAVLTLVYFYIIMIVHKCQQSAKRKLLLNNKHLMDEVLNDPDTEVGYPQKRRCQSIFRF